MYYCISRPTHIVIYGGSTVVDCRHCRTFQSYFEIFKYSKRNIHSHIYFSKIKNQNVVIRFFFYGIPIFLHKRADILPNRHKRNCRPGLSVGVEPIHIYCPFNDLTSHLDPRVMRIPFPALTPATPSPTEVQRNL